MKHERAIQSFPASDLITAADDCVRELPYGLKVGETVKVGDRNYRLPSEKEQRVHNWYLWQPPREALWLIPDDLARDYERRGVSPEVGFGWVFIDPIAALEGAAEKKQTAEDTELAALLYTAMAKEASAGGRPDTIMALSAAAERLSRGE